MFSTSCMFVHVCVFEVQKSWRLVPVLAGAVDNESCSIPCFYSSLQNLHKLSLAPWMCVCVCEEVRREVFEERAAVSPLTTVVFVVLFILF